MSHCEHCAFETAKWKCLECEADNEECLMCDDCKKEHIEAQYGIMPLAKARKMIVRI